MGECLNEGATIKPDGHINGQTTGLLGDSVKVRENIARRRGDPSSDNCYVKAMKRIVYLSLVIWSAGFRKLVETVTGIKLPRIHIDHRMVEGHRTNPDWVSFSFRPLQKISRLLLRVYNSNMKAMFWGPLSTADKKQLLVWLVIRNKRLSAFHDICIYLKMILTLLEISFKTLKHSRTSLICKDKIKYSLLTKPNTKSKPVRITAQEVNLGLKEPLHRNVYIQPLGRLKESEFRVGRLHITIHLNISEVDLLVKLGL